MSALAILRTESFVTIASDGAAYDGSTGNLMAVVSKVAVMPEWSCIFANRGMGGATAVMQAELQLLAVRGDTIRDFDDVLDRIPALAERMHRDALATPGAPTAHFSFFIGGYSEQRQRIESYTVRTRPVGDRPAFDLIGLQDIHLAPYPSPEAAARAGITRPQELPHGHETVAEDYAVRAVAACRLDRETDEGEGATGIHFVGGLLQLTTLYRGATFTRIVHRWPDPIGEPIDPTRGELLPALD
ncbi:hypothetical protein [Methylorubrum extorquens]